MTEFEQKILTEIADLRRVVEALRVDYSIAQITYFENLVPSAVVGADYVAYRFGCSEDAVSRGRFETNVIPRLRLKPLAFIKRDVDEVWLRLNQSNKSKAAKYRHQAGSGKTKETKNKRKI